VKKVFVFVSVLLLIMVMTGCNSKNKISVESSYEDFKQYSNFLEKVNGNSDDIQLYYSKQEDGLYYVQVQNNSSYFFIGTIEMYSKEKELIGSYDSKMIYPGESQFDYVKLSGELSEFVVEKAEFYNFTYENINYDYKLYSDSIDDKHLYSLLLDDYCTLENVIVVSKYQYAVGVIMDYYVDNLYFYNKDVKHYRKDSDEYPDIASAIYKTDMNFNNKQIIIYEKKNKDWQRIETLDMK